MSIQKLDFDTITHEQKPFTTIFNHVIQDISDAFAGFIWVYLQTLPPNWNVNSKQLMKHFGIGHQKLKKHLKFLVDYNLIEYHQKRTEQGRWSRGSIHVLNGSRYEVKILVEPPKTQRPIDSEPQDENTGAGFSATYKNNITSQRKITTTKISCSTEPLLNEKDSNSQTKEKPVHKPSKPANNPSAEFLRFWDRYPRKQGKPKAWASWHKQGLDISAELILERLEKQKSQDVQWQNKQYIPLPATYLNQQRWEDEIVTASTSTKHGWNNKNAKDEREAIY